MKKVIHQQNLQAYTMSIVNMYHNCVSMFVPIPNHCIHICVSCFLALPEFTNICTCTVNETEISLAILVVDLLVSLPKMALQIHKQPQTNL